MGRGDPSQYGGEGIFALLCCCFFSIVNSFLKRKKDMEGDRAGEFARKLSLLSNSLFIICITDSVIKIQHNKLVCIVYTVYKI